MANVKRTDFEQGMIDDMYGYFFDTWEQQSPVYTNIFKEEKSTRAWEQGTSVIGPGQLANKPEGDPITYRKIQEGWTTYGDNVTYADGITITKEAVDDHQKLTDVLREAAGKWAESVVHTKETFYAKAFNYGGYTAGHDFFKNPVAGQNAGGLIYDGKPLFNLSNNTRSSKGGGTYYNGLASDLTQANLITAWERMTVTNNRDERDEIIALVPDTLLVPPSLIMTARVILNSTNLPGSGNNDINVAANLVELVPWHYLTDTDAWFLGKRRNGLVAQNREEAIIDFYQDQDTKDYKANITVRFGFRADNWRYWVGSNFSTSA